MASLTSHGKKTRFRCWINQEWQRITHEQPAWMFAGASVVLLCFYVLWRWTRSCQVWKTSHSRHGASGMGVCQFKCYLCCEASSTELPKWVTYFTPCSFILSQISVQMVHRLHLFPKSLSYMDQETQSNCDDGQMRYGRLNSCVHTGIETNGIFGFHRMFF